MAENLQITFTGTGSSYKVGYRLNGSTDPYSYVSPNPTSSPVVVTGVADGDYQAEITQICSSGAYSTPVVIVGISPLPITGNLAMAENSFLVTNVVTININQAMNVDLIIDYNYNILGDPGFRVGTITLPAGDTIYSENQSDGYVPGNTINTLDIAMLTPSTYNSTAISITTSP